MFPDVRVAIALEHGRLQQLAELERLRHQHRRLVGETDALEIAIGIEAG